MRYPAVHTACRVAAAEVYKISEFLWKILHFANIYNFLIDYNYQLRSARSTYKLKLRELGTT